MDCPTCDSLRDRIAWLESELGLQRAETDLEKIREVIRESTKRTGTGCSQPARMILAMYEARGRVMSVAQIMEAIPPAYDHDDERGTKIVPVWVHHARRAMGADTIANAWGRGYYLTETGMARVSEILRQKGSQHDQTAR